MYTILTFLTKIWEDILQSGRQTACREGNGSRAGMEGPGCRNIFIGKDKKGGFVVCINRSTP